MADKTHIEWTDATWQPITGCAVVSPGCTNCYAMRLAGTRLKHHRSRTGLTQETKAGPVWTGEVRFNAAWLDQPLRWRRPRRIFVCAHGDLFAEAVPNQWIDRVFAVMALTPQHTFQVLTKRAERMRDYLAAGHGHDAPARQVHYLRTRLDAVARGEIHRPFDRIEDHIRQNGWPIYGEAGDWPLPNVWLGVSVEDQARADERIPLLLDTPAAVRFISAEPLLGPVDLGNLRGGTFDAITGCGDRERLGEWEPTPRLDWVIAGPESGPDARPWSILWARELRDQCVAAGTAFFWKQNGEWAPAGSGPSGEPGRFAFGDYEYDRSMRESVGDGRPRQFTTFGARSVMRRVGKKAAGRLLDGREWSEFPA